MRPMLTDPTLDLKFTDSATEAKTAEPPARCCDTGLFDDIPPAIWKVFLGSWVGVFALFALNFATDLSASFVIVISCFFGMMAFGLPIAMAAQSKRGPAPTGMIQTQSGPLSAWEAGAQIVSIPVAAVFGLTCFILFVM